MLSDYSAYTGKSAVIVEGQSYFTIRGLKWVVEGAVKNSKAFIDVRNSSYGLIDDITGVYESSSTSGALISFDIGSRYNSFLMDRYSQFNNTDVTPFSNNGANNRISTRSIGTGSRSRAIINIYREHSYRYLLSCCKCFRFYCWRVGCCGVSSGAFRPLTDNNKQLSPQHIDGLWFMLELGLLTRRTNEKTSISDPNEALMVAWSKVNFKSFKFTDAVEKKGSEEAEYTLE